MSKLFEQINQVWEGDENITTKTKPESIYMTSRFISLDPDGLFAAKQYTDGPSAWTTFGNDVPNSLFFAIDPVALDCVMHDFLVAEMSIDDDAGGYLPLAANAGLGVFEHGDPWGNGYQKIQYNKI